MFYFRLGVAIYSVSSRLEIIGRLISRYLILCTLDLIPSFIRVDPIFDFICYILDYIFKSVGFSLNIEEGELTPLIPWLSEKVVFFCAVA